MTKLLSLILIGVAIFAISCNNNSTSTTTTTTNPSIVGTWIATVTESIATGTITLVLTDSSNIVGVMAKISVPLFTINDSNIVINGTYNYPNITLNLPSITGSYTGTMAADGKSFAGTFNASSLGITNVNAVFTKQ